MVSQGCGARSLPSTCPSPPQSQLPQDGAFSCFVNCWGFCQFLGFHLAHCLGFSVTPFRKFKGGKAKHLCFEFRETWVQALDLPLRSCVLVAEPWPLSESQVLTSAWTVIGLLRWLTEKVPRKHSAWCLLPRSFVTERLHSALSAFYLFLVKESLDRVWLVCELPGAVVRRYHKTGVLKQ